MRQWKNKKEFEFGQNVFCIIICLQSYGSQEVEYGGLRENSPHRFKYLNVWSPVGGTISEGLRNSGHGGMSPGIDFEV